MVPDGCPATQKQAQLIASLTKDFPDAKKLPEYSNYCGNPTKVNASVFITRTLEDNWSDIQQRDSTQGQHTDRKLRRRIQEKKIAMGHKPDDHEEQGWGSMTM